MLVFEARRKLRYPERTSNNLKPHMASTPGFIWWEASALTTAPPLLADSARDSRDSPVATRRMDQLLP